MDDAVSVTSCDYGDAKGNTTAKCVHILAHNARGLGCDVARILFDAGLQILKTDVSIDGAFCLMLFIVHAPANVQVNWDRVARKLKQVVAADFTLCKQLNISALSPSSGAQGCNICIECENKIGLLHTLIECLWEADLHVAQSATKASHVPNYVCDNFLVYDSKQQLPSAKRKREIAAKLQEALPGWQMTVSFDCMTAAAPWPAVELDLRSSCIPQLCKDAIPRHSLQDVKCPVEQQVQLCPRQEGQSVFLSKGWGVQEDAVVISVDRCFDSVCTVVQVVCKPRKGLLYDLLRTTHELDVSVDHITSRIQPDTRLIDVQLFLRDATGNAIEDDGLLQALLLRLRKAVELPVVVSVSEGRESGTWEVWVFALPDSGMRGRPRVTYDVTTVLMREGLQVISGTVSMITDLAEAALPPAQAVDLAAQLSLASPHHVAMQTEQELQEYVMHTTDVASPLQTSVHTLDVEPPARCVGSRDSTSLPPADVFNESTLSPLRNLCTRGAPCDSAATAPTMSQCVSEQLTGHIVALRSAFLSHDGGLEVWSPVSRRASSRGMRPADSSMHRSLWNALSTKLSLHCAYSEEPSGHVLEMHHFVVEAGGDATGANGKRLAALTAHIRKELMGEYH